MPLACGHSMKRVNTEDVVLRMRFSNHRSLRLAPRDPHGRQITMIIGRTSHHCARSDLGAVTRPDASIAVASSETRSLAVSNFRSGTSLGNQLCRNSPSTAVQTSVTKRSKLVDLCLSS